MRGGHHTRTAGHKKQIEKQFSVKKKDQKRASHETVEQTRSKQQATRPSNQTKEEPK